MFDRMGLGTIIKRYRLMVPPNQREYSWKREHIETLFQDLAMAISDNEPEYFLGTIVGVDKDLGLLEIVDGQQRLATTVIFLCEMRNYLKPLESIIADSITKDFLTDIDRTKKDTVTKMKLNVSDNEYFKSLITNDTVLSPIKPSHKLIQEAFHISGNQIKKIVAGFNVKDHGNALNKWIDFIEHKAVVILLTVNNSVNAYKMFETLNDRGLKTSQADLVKNHLFGQAGSRLSEAQHKWSLMRGALETGYDEDITVIFLRHVLIAMRGHTRESEVFDETEKIARGESRSLAFLDNLEKLANTYVAITNPEHERWNNKYPDAIRQAIKTLNRLNIKPFQPILLAISEKFDPKEANNAMKIMISLGVRLLIASRTTSGPIEQTLSNTANSIYSNKVKDSKAMRKMLESIIPIDDDFKHAFENLTVSKAYLARYYLRSIEMAAKGEPYPWFIPNDDKETITLEHVLPEEPGTNWPAFTPDEVDAYYRRLGNLVLLKAKSNSDLKSINFEIKKNVYKDSDYILTSKIADVSDWTKEEIIKRQKDLAQHALKAWPI